MAEYDPREMAGLRPGHVLAGKYRIDRVLGLGGMGIVLAAHHLQLDETVAIKLLLPSMLENAVSLSRFLHEARAAAKIKSDHVARVFDVGTLESGAPYMVMEFLEGGDLAAWIDQRGALPVDQAVDFVLQACVAIAEAHRLGIVHRDLKPANLFCLRRPDGQLFIKVLDFGISKMASSGGGVSAGRTGPTALLGSPYYMSPEQMHSAKDVDARTDIWALGVLLYELVCGVVPFPGTSITEVATRVATVAPPAMRLYRSDVPPGLEGVIATCLAKDREARFANVAEFALALGAFAPPRALGYIERIAATLEPVSGLEPTLEMPLSRRPPRPAPASTAGSMGRTVGRGVGARTGVVALTLILLGAALVAGVLWIRAPHGVVRASGEGGGPVVSATASREAETPSAAPPATAAPPTLEASSLPTAAPPPHAERPPRLPAPEKRAAGSPARRPSPAASPSSSVPCRVVSTYDSDGTQHFKQVCDGAGP